MKIAHTETYIEYLQVGDFVIYTGNDRETGKYAFKIKKVYPSYISLFNISKREPFNIRIHEDSEYNEYIEVIPLSELTVQEAKEILIPAAFDALIAMKAFSNKENPCATIEWPENYKGEWVDKQTTKGKQKMSNKMKQIKDTNTQAAKAAAQQVAGKAINKAVLKKIKPHLPLVVRGYAKTAVGKVVLANIVSYAVNTYMSDNEKAKWAANAMMVDAMTSTMKQFDIEKMLNAVLDGIKVPEEVE